MIAATRAVFRAKYFVATPDAAPVLYLPMWSAPMTAIGADDLLS
jgi:hypothetical protein